MTSNCLYQPSSIQSSNPAARLQSTSNSPRCLIRPRRWRVWRPAWPSRPPLPQNSVLARGYLRDTQPAQSKPPQEKKKKKTKAEKRAAAEKRMDKRRRVIIKEDTAVKAEVLAALEALKAAEAAGTHPREAMDLSEGLITYEIHCAEHDPHVPNVILEDMDFDARRIEARSSSKLKPSDDPMGNGFDRDVQMIVHFNDEQAYFTLPTCRPSSKVWELENSRGVKVEITLVGKEYIIAKVPSRIALQDGSRLKGENEKPPEHFMFYGTNAEYILAQKRAKNKAEGKKEEYFSEEEDSEDEDSEDEDSEDDEDEQYCSDSDSEWEFY